MKQLQLTFCDPETQRLTLIKTMGDTTHVMFYPGEDYQYVGCWHVAQLEDSPIKDAVIGLLGHYKQTLQDARL